ncbi:MAG: caspase family protein [Sphingobacteriales bacterium]|nr:caspase family protein [Sphingobacteriales bacterium]
MQVRSLWLTGLLLLGSLRGIAQQPRLVLPVSSTNKLQEMLLSRDEKYLASTDLDGMVKFWDVASGKLIQTFNHPGAVELGLTADARYLVSASMDHELRVWDLETGRLFKTLSLHQTAICALAINADGSRMLSGDQSGTVVLWDLKTWEPLRVIQTNGGYIGKLEFAHKGSWFAMAAEKDIYLVPFADQPYRILKGHTDKVHSIEISANDEQLLSGSWDNTARLWDPGSGKLLKSFEGHTKSVFDAVFSPDSKKVLTAASDNSIRIWDIQTGKGLQTLAGHRDWVTKLRFSPDGRQLISISFDNTARIWNYPGGQLQYELKGHKDDLYYISVLKKTGKVLLGSYDNDVSSWDLRSGKLDFFFGLHNEKITSVSLSRSGRFAAHTYRDGRIKLIDLFTGKIALNINGHDDWATSAVFSNNDSLLFTAGTDNRLKIWSLPDGELLAETSADAGVVDASLELSRDGRQLLSYGGQTLSLLNLAQNTRITKTTSGSLFNKPVISNTGKYLAEVVEGLLRVTDADSGTLVSQFPISTSFPASLFFSTDDEYLFCTDKVLKAFRVQRGDTARAAPAFIIDSLPVSRAGWLNEKEKVLMITDTSRRIYRSDFPSGKPVLVFSPDNSSLLTEQDRYFRQVILSPGGEYLASFHTDYYRLWRFSDGKCIGRFDGDFLLFLPDSARFIVSNRGAMDMYDLKTGGLVYTHFIAGEKDYIVMDSLGRFDGTEAARKYLYFTCGKEIIELESVKDQLWVPGLADRIMQGDTVSSRTLAELDICGLTPVVDKSPGETGYRFIITPRRGGLGETILLVNGIEVKRYNPSQLIKKGGNYELSISREELGDLFIKGQENQVSIKCFTEGNTVSSRGLIVSEDKSKTTAAAPNLYALVVGVSDYKGDELDLKYAAKDARDISAAVAAASRKLLNTDGKEHVFMYELTTATPRYQLPEKNQVKKALDEIGKKATANDILLIFFAGHGVMEGAGKQFYFLTADASRTLAAEAVKEAGISTAELTDWIQPRSLKAQKRILIFDACNSGQAIKDFVKMGTGDQGYLAARNDDQAQQVKAIDKLNEKSGLFILSASASNQSAYELGRYSQGLLTYSLLKAIKQQPDILEEGKYLNVGRWFAAAEKNVSELSRENGARQEPQIVSTTNFNIGLVDEQVLAGIVLPQEKPLFAASNFQNSDEAVADDDLELSKQVNLQLTDLAARGGNSQIVYVTATNVPDAFSLSGRYRVSGNNITVTINLKQNRVVRQKFELSGTKDKLAELAAGIAARAAELVGQ